MGDRKFEKAWNRRLFSLLHGELQSSSPDLKSVKFAFLDVANKGQDNLVALLKALDRYPWLQVDQAEGAKLTCVQALEVALFDAGLVEDANDLGLLVRSMQKEGLLREVEYGPTSEEIFVSNLDMALNNYKADGRTGRFLVELGEHALEHGQKTDSPDLVALGGGIALMGEVVEGFTEGGEHFENATDQFASGEIGGGITQTAFGVWKAFETTGDFTGRWIVYNCAWGGEVLEKVIDLPGKLYENATTDIPLFGRLTTILSNSVADARNGFTNVPRLAGLSHLFPDLGALEAADMPEADDGGENATQHNENDLDGPSIQLDRSGGDLSTDGTSESLDQENISQQPNQNAESGDGNATLPTNPEAGTSQLSTPSQNADPSDDFAATSPTNPDPGASISELSSPDPLEFSDGQMCPMTSPEPEPEQPPPPPPPEPEPEPPPRQPPTPQEPPQSPGGGA